MIMLNNKIRDANLEFLKNFSKISIRSICIKLNIDPSNIYTAKASDDLINKVRCEVEQEINNIYRREREMLYDKNI